MSAETQLEKRARATSATQAQFERKPFKLGRYDCGRMAAAHLVKMGKPLKTLAAGTYHSPLGAVKALKKLGHDTLADLFDSKFKRIPWSRALVGDIILLPADPDGAGGFEALGALAIAMGNGRALLYHPDAEGACVAQVVDAVTAWRIIPVPGEEE